MGARSVVVAAGLVLGITAALACGELLAAAPDGDPIPDAAITIDGACARIPCEGGDCVPAAIVTGREAPMLVVADPAPCGRGSIVWAERHAEAGTDSVLV